MIIYKLLIMAIICVKALLSLNNFKQIAIINRISILIAELELAFYIPVLKLLGSIYLVILLVSVLDDSCRFFFNSSE